MDKTTFAAVLRSFCIVFDEKQLDNLYLLMDLTLKKNQVMNLTSIKDEEEFLIKMILDSALSFNDVNLSGVSDAIDVGTGGGFPGLVLAILYPNIHFTLLDATKKKCDHVFETAKTIGLNNVSVINDRAENFAPKHREEFDIVTARAVSYLNMLLELCIPLLKVGGLFVALKGKIAEGELVDSKDACNKLDCELKNKYTYELLNDSGERTNFQFKKLKKTKTIYPRSYNVIKKKPL